MVKGAAGTGELGRPGEEVGLLPDAGGRARRPRAIRERLAREMSLPGRGMGADGAPSLGLASRVVPGEALLEAALELATIIARAALQPVASARDLLRDPAGLGVEAGHRHLRSCRAPS